MIGLKKKICIAALTIACLQPVQLRSQVNLGTKIALGVGGTVAAGLVGTLLYKTFKPLTDSEVIFRAQNVYSDAQNMYICTSACFEIERTLLQESTNELKQSIKAFNQDSFPFLSFKRSLDHAIESIDQMVQKINTITSQLLKRKLQLQINNDFHMTSVEAILYLEQYNEINTLLLQQKESLLLLNNDLKRLRYFTVGLDEYNQEHIFYRINNLEKQVNALKSELYYHTTSCCSHNNTQYLH